MRDSYETFIEKSYYGVRFERDLRFTGFVKHQTNGVQSTSRISHKSCRRSYNRNTRMQQTWVSKKQLNCEQ